MDTLTIILQVGLAAVFATAGVGKLIDRGGGRATLEGFGVPEPVTRVAAPALPFVELAIAALLIPTATARWAALAAFLMLLVFIGGIANALRQGRTPDCGCFGQLHSAPAGRGTLARNIGLAAAALFVFIQGPDVEVWDWIADRSAGVLIAIGAGIVTLAAVVVVRQRRRAKLVREQQLEWERTAPEREAAAAARKREREGLPIGTPAPDFEFTTTSGEARSLNDLLSGGRPALLMFFDAGCGPCKPLVPHIARWQKALADRLSIVVIADGRPERVQAIWAGYDADVLLDVGQEVTLSYRMAIWPSAIAVSARGRIAADPVYTWDAIEVLIGRMLSDPPDPEERIPESDDDEATALDVTQWGPSTSAA